MNRLRLPGTDLDVSVAALGTTTFGTTISEPETFALLDRFVELGGNFIDTAKNYSDWVPGERSRSERILGDWLQARGNRGRLVIATKGMRPLTETPDIPRSSAAEIRQDLEGSLARMRIEMIDLYWLHRDDPARPAGYFVDVLNVFRREGKIRAFGVSNWSAARLRAANEHARATGQQGFVANQPFWCLGCQQAAPLPNPNLVPLDAETYRYHLESGLAVIPYSSQARGFFSKLALPENQRPANFTQGNYHTPANVETGRIVASLARAKGVPITAVVLSYLFSHRLTVVPILGCHSIPQLEDSVAALPVRLTGAELRSLDEASRSGLPSGPAGAL